MEEKLSNEFYGVRLVKYARRFPWCVRYFLSGDFQGGASVTMVSSYRYAMWVGNEVSTNLLCIREMKSCGR